MPQPCHVMLRVRSSEVGGCSMHCTLDWANNRARHILHDKSPLLREIQLTQKSGPYLRNARQWLTFFLGLAALVGPNSWPRSRFLGEGLSRFLPFLLFPVSSGLPVAGPGYNYFDLTQPMWVGVGRGAHSNLVHKRVNERSSWRIYVGRQLRW